MTGVISPLASKEARSTSSDLPVPATGAVKACSGAVAMAWRSSAVSTRLNATERSTCSTKGNSSNSVSSRYFSASRACCSVGAAGTDGKLWPRPRM